MTLKVCWPHFRQGILFCYELFSIPNEAQPTVDLTRSCSEFRNNACSDSKQPYP